MAHVPRLPMTIVVSTTGTEVPRRSDFLCPLPVHFSMHMSMFHTPFNTFCFWTQTVSLFVPPRRNLFQVPSGELVQYKFDSGFQTLPRLVRFSYTSSKTRFLYFVVSTFPPLSYHTRSRTSPSHRPRLTRGIPPPTTHPSFSVRPRLLFPETSETNSVT